MFIFFIYLFQTFFSFIILVFLYILKYGIIYLYLVLIPISYLWAFFLSFSSFFSSVIWLIRRLSTWTRSLSAICEANSTVSGRSSTDLQIQLEKEEEKLTQNSL